MKENCHHPREMGRLGAGKRKVYNDSPLSNGFGDSIMRKMAYGGKFLQPNILLKMSGQLVLPDPLMGQDAGSLSALYGTDSFLITAFKWEMGEKTNFGKMYGWATTTSKRNFQICTIFPCGECWNCSKSRPTMNETFLSEEAGNIRKRTGFASSCI